METTIMENQMEKKMENEMETGMIRPICKVGSIVTVIQGQFHEVSLNHSNPKRPTKPV